MEMNASEFKAKCLALIDQVHQGGEPILIRKRGRIVARFPQPGHETYRCSPEIGEFWMPD
jgi:antitoxin (DNA-binding transcriptional repressor) of toxin-antitoxin stability system